MALFKQKKRSPAPVYDPPKFESLSDDEDRYIEHMAKQRSEREPGDPPNHPNNEKYHNVTHHDFPQTRSPKTNLHPKQFGTTNLSGTRGKDTSGRHSKPYEGKRRAPYSPGKDIGGSVGASKKPEYTGRHSGPAEGKHGKAYNFDADAATSIGKGKGPDYTGRHRPKPKGEGKHGKPYDADRDIAQSMKGHKKDYVGKHSSRYKPEKKIGPMPAIHFKPSKHAGKNKEHLKALVK